VGTKLYIYVLNVNNTKGKIRQVLGVASFNNYTDSQFNFRTTIKRASSMCN